MIDAKRLAEIMEPGKLLRLAEYLDSLNGSLSLAHVESKVMADANSDGLDCAAAVLREVAERYGSPATCCLADCDKQATAGPLCGPHLLDFAPITCCVNGCKDAATLEDGTPLTARVAFGEVPMCVKHYELWRKAREVEARAEIQPGEVEHDVKACVDAHDDCDGGQCDMCQHFPYETGKS